MSKFYVYGLFDPKENELRYVGKAKDPKHRYLKHLSPSKLKTSTHKNNWIKSLLVQNLKPSIQIFEEFSSEEEAFDYEIFYISYFKWLGCRLTNTTNGGEGGFTGNPSEQTLLKIKEINSRPKSETHKKQISLSHLGIKPSIETREKLRSSKIESNNSVSKLDDEKVRIIRKLLKDLVQINKISKIFDVSRRTISDIKNNRRWTHVK